MPFANLAAESCLLSTGGWFKVGRAPIVTSALGADRHGKWSTEEVRVSTIANERPIYIGTPSGFGILTASSRLLMSDGSVVLAKSFVDQARISEHWFETAADAAMNIHAPNFGGFVSELVAVASFCSDQKIALRRTWFTKPMPENIKGYAVTTKAGGSQFCILNTNALAKHFAADWISTVEAIVDYCFCNEEGLPELSRGCSTLIAWYISALHARKISFELGFESLQHTSVVIFKSSGVRLPPVVRGSCACASPITVPAAQLSWTVTGWSPVANGFFLKGG